MVRARVLDGADRRAAPAEPVRVVAAGARRRVVVGRAQQHEDRGARHLRGAVRDAAGRVERDVGGEARAALVDDGAPERLERAVERDLAAARESDDADPRGIDARVGGEEPERRERVGEVGHGRELALVARGRRDPAQAEAFDRERRDAEGLEPARPPVLAASQHPAAAVGNHHRRHRPGGVRGQDEVPGDDHAVRSPLHERGRPARRDGTELDAAGAPVGQRGHGLGVCPGSADETQREPGQRQEAQRSHAPQPRYRAQAGHGVVAAAP